MSDSKQVGDLKAGSALADPSFLARLGAPPTEPSLLAKSEAPAPDDAPRKTTLVIERKTPRNHFRGIPPPLDFDIFALPATARLNEAEAAAALRRARSALEYWRKDKAHPLTWTRVAGRILYDLPPILEMLRGNSL